MRIAPIVCLLVMSSFCSHAQTWEWARNAGNFNPMTNGYSGVSGIGVATDIYSNVYTLGSYYDTLRLRDTVVVSRNGTTNTQNLFIAKYNQWGDRLWIRNFKDCRGLSGAVRASQLAVDVNGDIIFTGLCSTTFGGSPIGGRYFMCKMKEDGQMIWVKYFANEVGFTLDKTGNIYSTFNYYTSDTFSFGGLSISKINTVCLGKFSSNGAGVWLKQFPATTLYDHRVVLDVNPAGNELLFCDNFGGTITIEGTVYNSTSAPGMIARFSTGSGDKKKVIPVKSTSNTFFNLNYAKWMTDSSIAFTAGNYAVSNSVFVINDSSINTNYTGGNQHIFNAGIDTAGKVKWNNLIKGGPGEFSYQSTYGYSIGVSGNNVYVLGSVMRNSSINGDTMYRDYVAQGFVARYDFNGVYKLYATGGMVQSISSLKHFAADQNQKIYVTGGQQHWSTFGAYKGIFGKDTLAPLGSDQFYFGKLEGNSNVISGKVFIDYNNDGNFSGADKPINNVLIKVLPSGALLSSNGSGNYYSGFGTGSYTLTPFANIPVYYTITPATYSGNFTTLNNDLRNQHFRLLPIPNVNDLAIDVTQLNRARPGFNTTYQITYRNKGTTTLSGQYSMKLDPQFSFLNSDSTLAASTADSIVFTYSNLAPFESRKNLVTFTISPNASNFYTAIHKAYIYPVANDTTKPDNQFIVSTPVRGAWDPNQKSVFPLAEMILDSVQSGGQFLDYTLSFQNTGTDTAINIKITDSLSALLKFQSIQLIASSHPVSMEIKGQRTIDFYFRNIYLVDSFANEKLSHGFVKIRVKPEQTVTVTDTVFNNCNIYFDYNAPVLTNTVKNYFTVSSLPVNLKNFLASKKNLNALLTWQTASEQNTSVFDVQWKPANGNFNSIGVVNASNNALGSKYQFLHTATAVGINFYRLKTIDNDGKFQYSEIKSLHFEQNGSLQVTPNPALTEILCSLPGRLNNPAVLRIYDVNRRVMFVKTLAATGNFVNEKIDVSDLASGNYILSINIGSKNYSGIFYKK